MDMYKKILKDINDRYDVIEVNGKKYVGAGDTYAWTLDTDALEYVSQELEEVLVSNEEAYNKELLRLYGELSNMLLKEEVTHFDWEDYRFHMYDMIKESLDKYVEYIV
jgi:hypothetical protein